MDSATKQRREKKFHSGDRHQPIVFDGTVKISDYFSHVSRKQPILEIKIHIIDKLTYKQFNILEICFVVVRPTTEKE